MREILASADRFALLADIKNQPERLFLTGCLSLEIGAWAGAKDLLRRADHSTREAPELESFAREVRFFRCLALRLAAESGDFLRDYSRARRWLDELLTTSGKNNFDRVRNMSERVALDLCEMALEYRPHTANETAKRHLDRAIDALLHIDKTNALALVLDGETDEAAMALGRQIWLNTMDAAFWSRALTGELGPSLAYLTEHATELFDRGASGDEGSPHGLIYRSMGELALNRGDLRVHSEKIIAAIDNVIEMDRELGFAFDLPAVDGIEFRNIYNLVVQQSGLPAIR